MEKITKPGKFSLKRLLKPSEWIGLLLLTAMVIPMAWSVPMDYCPDEQMRSRIAYWIYRFHALPTGYEAEIISPIWGFSYSSEPLLPSILSAIFMIICDFFGGNDHAVFFAARMVNVLSLLGSYLVCLRIGKKVFSRNNSPLLFAVLICFTPQVIFCGSYLNSDLPALFGCLLTLDSLLGCRESHWQIKPCIRLAVSLSVILLTYYNAYGWVLISLIWCIVHCSREQKKAGSVSGLLRKRFALVAGAVLVLSGWFFIRNMILFKGDPTGISYRNISALAYEALGNTVHRMEPYSAYGTSVFHMIFKGSWFNTSFSSLFARLGYMDISIDGMILTAFICLFCFGFTAGIIRSVIRIRRKEQQPFDFVCLLALILIPLILSVIYSYCGDYQPQGRYLFPAFPAMALFCVDGYQAAFEFLIKKKAMKRNLITCVTLIWLILSGYAFIDTVRPEMMNTPGLKAVYTDSQDGKSLLELQYSSMPSETDIRFAVWSKADRSDLVWYSSFPASQPGKSYLWTAAAETDCPDSGTVCTVQVYGTNHRGEEVLIDEYRIGYQAVLLPTD